MINNAISSTTATGTYTGDASANRAIPHGMGVIPKLIFIMNITAMTFIFIDGATGKLGGMTDAANTSHTQTTPTNTYFYVGEPATAGFWGNDNANEFIWYAWR